MFNTTKGSECTLKSKQRSIGALTIDLDVSDAKEKLNEIEEQLDRILGKYEKLEEYQQSQNKTHNTNRLLKDLYYNSDHNYTEIIRSFSENDCVIKTKDGDFEYTGPLTIAIIKDPTPNK